MPPNGAATAATKASGAAAPYERASAKVPERADAGRASFTAVANTSTFDDAAWRAGRCPIDQRAEQPPLALGHSVAAGPRVRVESGQWPARSCSPRRYSQPRYADWVSPWKK